MIIHNAFDKIIGYEGLKHELNIIADIIKNPSPYAELGLEVPKGILFAGSPGLGKTLMAFCTAEAGGRKVFVCRRGEKDGNFCTVIRSVFLEASKQPSTVILDDLDKFANSDSRTSNNDEYVTVQSCIDEFAGDNLFVIATANSSRALPASLRRPGRFDRIFNVKAPNVNEAKEIIAYYLRDKKPCENLDCEYLAKLMKGSSCADLEIVLNEAAAYAVYDQSESIKIEHFLKAYQKIHIEMTCADDDDMNINDYSDRKAQQYLYHSAGHAVISELLVPGSVTIIMATGKSESSRYGGGTRFYYDNRLNPSFIDKVDLAVDIAGKAAVDCVFGTFDDVSLREISSFYSNLVGRCCKEGAYGLHFIAAEQSENEIARMQCDCLVAYEAERIYRQVKNAINKNREFLEKIVSALREKQILSAEDIKNIRESCTLVPLSV